MSLSRVTDFSPPKNISMAGQPARNKENSEGLPGKMAAFLTLYKNVVFLAFLFAVFYRKYQRTEEFYSGDLSVVLAVSNEANKLQISPTNNHYSIASRRRNSDGVEEGVMLFRLSLNPGPPSKYSLNKCRVAVFNARSFTSFHVVDNQKYVSNLSLFQSQVYSDNFHVICVTET